MKVTATTGLLAYLFAVDYVSIASATTRTLDTNQILLKGSSNNIRTRGEELPTTHQQQRRRGQDVAPKDKVPKDAPPTVGDEATTAPDQNAPPPNKESKQPKDGNQSKDKKTVIDKKKETSKFSELSASNDCQIKFSTPSEIEIECMANAVASSSPDTVGGPKDGDNAKDKKDKKGKDAKRNNKIDFTIRTSKSGVSVAVDYDEEVSDGTTSATSYEISYDRIIEYTKKGNRRFGFGGNDNNNENSNANDMAYDFDNDEIVQTIQLNEWSDLSEVSLDSTGSSSYFSASTKDGTAKFNFFMNKASEGEDITSNKVKIDVWVIDFPYRKNNGESYVALLSNVNSQRAVGYKRPIDTIDPATSNAATNDRQAPPKGGSKKSKSKVNIVFRDDNTVNEAASSANEIPELPVGEYTWATTAESFTDSSAATNVAVSSIQSDEAGGTADPSMVSVIATSPSNGKDDNLEIAFSFIGLNSPKTMYWDPETGVGYASTSDATISDADSNMNDDFFQTGSDTNNGGSSSSYVPNRYGTVLSLVATFFGSCLLLSL